MKISSRLRGHFLLQHSRKSCNGKGGRSFPLSLRENVSKITTGEQ